MIKVKDIYDYLDEIAPFACQEEWDNSGLLVGDFDNEVKKIAVVLDVSCAVMEQAIAENVDLIISHHPLIFKPVKNFLSDSIAYQLAINGISVISTHTCFDCADGGVNDVLCEMLNMRNIAVLPTNIASSATVRVGFVDETTAEELAENVSSSLRTNVSFVSGREKIKTVAVCTGSGSDFIGEVLAHSIDAFITGEASYHTMLTAEENGLTVITAGHFETEKPAMEELKNRMKLKFSEIEFVDITEENSIKYI